MRVTIIPSEKKVVVDGRPIIFDNWNFSDGHIHAIQWNHDRGHIEFVTRDPNQDIESLDYIQKYLDIFFDEIPKIEQIRMKREEEERKKKEEERLALLSEDEEKEQMKKMVEHTIEENRKIRAAKVALEAQRTKEIVESENETRRLEIEKKRLEIENERIKSEQEIASREKFWNEHFQKQNESLLEAHDKLSGVVEKVDNTVKSYFDKFDEKKTVIEDNINAQISQLKESEKILEEKNKLSKDEIAQQYQRINDLNKKLSEETQLTFADINNRYKELEERSSQIAQLRDLAETSAQNLIAQNDIQLEQINLERQRIIELKQAHEQEIKNMTEMLEIQKAEIQVRKKELESRENEIQSKILQKDIEYEMRSYEQLKNLAIENLVEQETRNIVRDEAQNRAAKAIAKIAQTEDPLDMFKAAMMDPAISLETLPMDKIIGWFSKIQKAQELCKKYNITYEQLLESKELRDMLQFTF